MLFRYPILSLCCSLLFTPLLAQNDDCEGAITITCGSITTGSTVNATADGNAPDCGTPVSAPGVWYHIEPTEGYLRLNTCSGTNYDTKINVYTGACDDLQCVTGNDDGPFDCGFEGLGSDVYGYSDGTEDYYVLVQGYENAVGDFELGFGCTQCAAAFDLFVTPADDEAIVYWTPVDPLPPDVSYILEYGPDGFSPGSGTIITGAVGADGPPVNVPGLTLGTEYDLYVTIDCSGGDLSEVFGPVSFTTLDEVLAPNAICTDAEPISCGGSTTGNTGLGLFTPVPSCGSAFADTPGLWYKVTGNGQDITASTCDQADFDTKISVFTGGCGALECVAGVDDGTGCGANSSLVTFASTAGVEYLLLVHGYDQSMGEFTLSVSCAEACTPAVANDDCAGAAQLVPQLTGACVPLDGTNVCAYTPAMENPICDPYSEAHDVWYALNTGPSADHTITVATITAEVMGVALYSGCTTADYIDCAVSSDGPMELNGLELNTTYYIQVWNGGGTSAGTFTICDEAPVIVGVSEDGSPASLHAWPLPADDLLTVEGLDPLDRLTMHDAQGRAIFTARAGQRVLDVSGLAPGAYILKVEGEGVRVLRVVVR